MLVTPELQRASSLGRGLCVYCPVSCILMVIMVVRKAGTPLEVPLFSPIPVNLASLLHLLMSPCSTTHAFYS